ncbi:hypothetical protein [Methylobacterium sp. A54F]
MTVRPHLALALSLCLSGIGLGALAQDLPRLDARRGALLIHGNFCGPGNRGPGYPPVDALDRACMHHDACTPEPASGQLPHCACHDRLHAEAGLIAEDPRTPDGLRGTARFIADGALVLPCLD